MWFRGGLESAACRNPLGMLERPWCFVAEEPFIERCALDECAPHMPEFPADVKAATSSVWVKVLVVICSIAGVLLIALLLVLLVRALWGGSLCPSLKRGPRCQGRSKRERSCSARSKLARSHADSFFSDAPPLSEVEEKAVEESLVESEHHSTDAEQQEYITVSGQELVPAQPLLPYSHARPQSAKHRPSQGHLPAGDMHRRFSEPHALSHVHSMNRTRSSTGDGRSTASSRGLRPTTPPLHKSSHGEIRSYGSPMHSSQRAASDNGDLYLLERPQPGSSRSPRDQTASGVVDQRYALISSPTLRQIMERASPRRTNLMGGSTGVVPEHCTLNSSAGKSPREGDLRYGTSEEEGNMHGIHDVGQRGMVYSVDSRSYATSSLQDVGMHSAAFASGAVNSGAVPTARSNTRAFTNELQHTTEASTIALDTTASAAVADSHPHSGSTGVADLASRDRLSLHQQHATAAADFMSPGARAVAAAAGVQTSWGSPLYRGRPDTERTISGSLTNSNSSPTGTLASRVAMQSPAGASFNMSAVEGAVLGALSIP